MGEWGDLLKRDNRAKFRKYVESLKDAAPFLKHEGSVKFWKSLSWSCKAAINTRLEEVDPEGLKEIRRRARNIRKSRKRQKKLVIGAKEIKETTIAVQKTAGEVKGTNIIKFMDIGGLKHVLAICIAAGYERDEVAAIAEMEPTDLNVLVTDEDVMLVKKRLPHAIEMAADGIVLRDLVSGKAEVSTKRADDIAVGRKKLRIDTSAEGRALRKESEELEDDREKHLRDRFKVDRKEGKVIDVKAEEVKTEKE